MRNPIADFFGYAKAFTDKAFSDFVLNFSVSPPMGRVSNEAIKQAIAAVTITVWW